MISFVRHEEDYSKAKEIALEIINDLHGKAGDNYEISLQAIEMAFISLLEDQHRPMEVFTSLVLSENLDEVKRVLGTVRK